MTPDIALLSALMQAGDKQQNIVDDVSELVSPNDFENEYHRLFYTTILNLRQKQSNYTSVEVAAALGGEHVAGAVMIESKLVPWKNAIHYAKALADSSAKKRIENIASAVTKLAENKELTPEQLYDEVMAVVSKAEPKTASSGGLTPITDLLPAYWEELELLSGNPGQVNGIKTNKPELDRILHGFKNKDLIVLAARPSVGKTAFSLDLMLEMMRQNVTVCFFSVEMSKDKGMLDRIISNTTNVDTERLSTGYIREDDWPMLTIGMGTFTNKLMIDDTPDMSLQHIKRQARQTRRKIGEDAPMIIFVDYMQIIKKPNGMNDYEAIGYFSRELKMLAKELNCPVVALSQLNRGSENRQDKRPGKADLRGSGQIEQDADVIIFLHRDDYRDPNAERKNIVDVIVDKHRNGRTGDVEMVFLKERGKFLNLDRYAK